MLLLAPIVFTLAVAADASNPVRVSASGASMTVSARTAPVSAVLEEIARQSGAKITYDGAPPRMLVTCDFVAATATEAFLRTLEGLGLNYALFGGTFARPATVLISSPSGSAVRAARSTVAGPEQGTDASEDDAGLAEAPPDGAAPLRLRRSEPQQAPPPETDAAPPAAAPPAADAPVGIQPLQMPTPQPAAPAAGTGDQQRSGGGPGRRRGGPPPN